MRLRWLLTSAAVLAAVPLFAASGGDDTLRFYLSKAELVVAAEILDEPFGISTEAGVVRYACRVRVTETLKGQKPTNGEIVADVIRFELGREDRSPDLKKGGRCVLFLEPAPGRRFERKGKPYEVWKVCDPWFGFQRHSPSLVRHLRSVLKDAEQAAGHGK